MPNGNERNSESGRGPETQDERPLRWAPEEPPPPPSSVFLAPPDESPLAPPPGQEPVLPTWERLEEAGFFRSLFLTIGEVLFRPASTFARMPRVPDLARPLLFLVLVGTISTAIPLGYYWLGQVLPPEIAWLLDPNDLFVRLLERLGVPLQYFEPLQEEPSVRQVVLSQACCLLMTPIVWIILAFVASGIVHVMLLLLGGANHGYETTFRTLCYAGGAASVFSLIPICGQIPIGVLCAIVCSIIGLTQTQEAHPGQAAVAVVVPVVGCCFCAVLVVIACAFFVQAMPQPPGLW